MAEAESDVYSAAIEYGGQCIGIDSLKDEQKSVLVQFLWMKYVFESPFVNENLFRCNPLMQFLMTRWDSVTKLCISLFQALDIWRKKTYFSWPYEVLSGEGGIDLEKGYGMSGPKDPIFMPI